jgi:hypothetical protein
MLAPMRIKAQIMQLHLSFLLSDPRSAKMRASTSANV